MSALAASRIREAVWSRNCLIFFAREAQNQPPRTDARWHDLVLVHCGSEHAHRYAKDIGTDSAGTFTKRLSDHTHCFAVERHGRLVHATWFTTCAVWTREIRAYVRPPAGEGYIYESFTRPDARGRGIYPFALEAISAYVGERGVKRLWVAAEEDNHSSIRAISKGGFERQFAIGYRRAFGRLTFQGPAGAVPKDHDFFTPHPPAAEECSASWAAEHGMSRS